MNVTIFFSKLQTASRDSWNIFQMDETNGRVCLLQMDDIDRDTKLE